MAIFQLDDIQSLTDFQRETRKNIIRLKRTGRPAILTVKGQAELVVQDARSYQKLLARVEEAERQAELMRSIGEYRAGHMEDAETVFDDLEARYSPKAKRPPAHPRRE